GTAFGDGAGIAVLGFGAPDLGHQPQRGQQVAGADQDDLAGVGVVVEVGVAAQGLEEGGLDRHEHQHQVRAVQPVQAAVVLLAELAHVVAQGLGVPGQVLLALGLGNVAAGALVVQQRHLGVDDDLPVLGQQQQGVRAIAIAVLVGEALLGEVLLPLLQAGAFQQALELELAPVALGAVVGGQGAGQAVGLLGQLPVELEQLPQLRLQAGPLLAFLLVGFADQATEVADLLAQRVEQLPQLAGVLLAEAAGLVLEDLLRQLLELGLEPVAGLLQVAVALLGGALLLLQAGTQHRQLGLAVAAAGFPGFVQPAADQDGGRQADGNQAQQQAKQEGSGIEGHEKPRHQQRMPEILGAGGLSRRDGPAQAAFLAQALHQAAAGTLKPGNRLQAPVAAVKNWQLPQLLPGLKEGWLTLLASSV